MHCGAGANESAPQKGGCTCTTVHPDITGCTVVQVPMNPSHPLAATSATRSGPGAAGVDFASPPETPFRGARSPPRPPASTAHSESPCPISPGRSRSLPRISLPLASTAHSESPCPASPLLRAVTAAAQASLSHPLPSPVGRREGRRPPSGQGPWLALPALPAPGLRSSMAWIRVPIRVESPPQSQCRWLVRRTRRRRASWPPPVRVTPAPPSRASGGADPL
jgi:hypothetical protein